MEPEMEMETETLPRDGVKLVTATGMASHQWWLRVGESTLAYGLPQVANTQFA
jgi:hypothetical protein